MEEDKVIIIGAGIAGLAAGIYARLNGYDAEVFEAHGAPGGLCTGWRREGYTFDGCIQWIPGASPASPFHRYWTELGVLPSISIDAYHEILHCEREDGKSVVLHGDADRLEQNLASLSPEDSARAALLSSLVKKVAGIAFSLERPSGLMMPSERLAALRSMSSHRKDLDFLTSTSIGAFALGFRHAGIRRALCAVIPQDYSLLDLVSTLADFHSMDAGFPAGGSLAFSGALADRFRALGGVLHLGRRVKKILVERRGLSSAARGIMLEDGAEARAGAVVSAADGRTTIYGLLGGVYRNRAIDALYRDSTKYKLRTSMQVSFGIRALISGEPDLLDIPMAEPLCIGDRAVNRLRFKVYRPEWGLAPEGCSVVSCLIPTSYEHWAAFRRSRGAYIAEKNRIALAVRRELERRFPASSGHLDAVDVATPLTYERHTSVWRGAYMSWTQTPQTGRIHGPETLPGLQDFYQAGMWVLPAGVSMGAVTGRWAVQRLCRRDRKEFRTGL